MHSERRARDAGADVALGALRRGRHERPHERGVALLGHPRLEVVGGHDAREAGLFGGDAVVDQLGRVELLEHRGIPDRERAVGRHGMGAWRSCPRPLGCREGPDAHHVDAASKGADQMTPAGGSAGDPNLKPGVLTGPVVTQRPHLRLTLVQGGDHTQEGGVAGLNVDLEEQVGLVLRSRSRRTCQVPSRSWGNKKFLRPGGRREGACAGWSS